MPRQDITTKYKKGEEEEVSSVLASECKTARARGEKGGERKGGART